MGMTDMQFKAFRRQQLREYEEMLETAKAENAVNVAKKLQRAIEEARADLEA